MSTQTCTVLIVEDSPPDQEMYRRCLRADSSCAYRFLEANTAALGLTLCQTQAIDVILLDYSLPDANGLSFLETLQLRSNGSNPPVIMISGVGDERIAVQAIKLGAEDYLVKRHLTPELLQLTMRSAIENAHLRLQLQQSEHRFRTSVENLLDCFGIYSAIRDASGQIIDFRIDYLNAAALVSNQMTPEDIGRELCDRLPAHRESGLFEAYCRVVETGEPLVIENFVYSDTFGAQRFTRAYDLQASKLDDGFVASWRDVTARRQTELDRQRIENERQQQLERERILNQMTQQIRRSLNPAEVLNTAVTEVRQFLGGDRAFIYRFDPDFSGVIVVESVAPGWRSALAAAVEDTYFIDTHGEDYRQGRIQVVEDIHRAGLTDCHVEMLERFQIRANLVVPILQREHLWGLLVINQCAHTRQWQPSEVELLQQIATQIGIAIQQAELHQQIQHSQERLSLSLEIAHQGMWDYDLATDRAYWSPQCKRLFGLEPDDSPVSYEQFNNCLHPEDRDRVADVSQSALQTHGNYDIEYRVVWPDGSVHWIYARGKYLRDEQGQPRRVAGTVMDISDRKQLEAERRSLEEALWQNEERLRLAIQGAGMATWDLDLQTGRAVWSEGHFHILGYPPHPAGEATQEMWRNCVHPDDLEQVMQAVEQARQSRSICTSEHRIIRADNGETRWIQAFGRFLYDDTEEPTRFLGIFFDATAFKQTERALAQSNERFQLAAAAVNCLIYDYDLTRGTIERSQSLTSLFGYSPEEADPTPEWWFDRIHPDQRMFLQECKQAAAFSTETSYCFEYQVQHRDGHYLWVQDHGFIVRNTAGQATRIVGSTIDITDRKRNEQQLRASEEQLKLGVQVAGVAIAHFDYTTDTVTLSPEAARVYGFSPDQSTVTRDQIHATFHPEEFDHLMAIIQQVLDPSGTGWFACEHRIVWPNGEERWLNVRKQVFFDSSSPNPRPSYAVLAAVDITDRARLLAESEAARAEAEAANRSKDEFVALVAHELRSPLNAVLGWVRLLQSSQLDASTTARALDTITRNTYAQVQLVEDLLDVSRMVRGTLQLTMAPTDLNEVVDTAIETIRPTAVNKRLRLDTHLNDTTPIWGDFNRLQQVVLNLLTNAIKFTPEGGQILVILEQQDAQVCLQVRDNGQGIRPEFLSLIFERFQQGQQTSTTKQGLGLGLAIVKYLVEQHGGTITVDSLGEGQGSTFTVMLPLQADQPYHPDDDYLSAALTPETHPLDGVRILLVDDEPDLLELIAFILDDYGATVQTASSAAAALELLTQFQPDVLLSDIAMPGTNGYVLLQQVRMIDPEGQIPAIAFTAYASQTRFEESLRAGFQQHFTKPVEPEQLVAAILNLIRLQRQ